MKVSFTENVTVFTRIFESLSVRSKKTAFDKREKKEPSEYRLNPIYDPQSDWSKLSDTKFTLPERGGG